MTEIQPGRLELPGRRSVEICPYRTVTHQDPEQETALCDLVRQTTGFRADFCHVTRAACEVCCLSAWPCTDKLNPVIGSLICDSATKVIEHPESDPSEVSRATRLRKEAIYR